MADSTVRGGTAGHTVRSSTAQSVGGSVGLSEFDLSSTEDFSRTYASVKDYYVGNANVQGGGEHSSKPIQLLPGLSNFSGLVLGDDRITINESIMSAQMRVAVEDKLVVPSPSKNKSVAVRRKEYLDAQERVGDVEMNRLERLMKDKLVQRSAKSSSSFQVMKAFKFFDRDQVGKVSIEGFMRSLEFLGFQFSDLQNLALFARYDPACSGDLDYAAFINSAMFDPPVNASSPSKGAAHAARADAAIDDFDIAQVRSTPAPARVSEFVCLRLHCFLCLPHRHPPFVRPQLTLLQESEIRRVFAKVDRDNRGHLATKDEFELTVLALGYNASAPELDDHYQTALASASADGRLTFDVFYAWWRGNLGKDLKSTRK